MTDATIIPFPSPRVSTETTATDTESYFGGCPECGGNDGYLNIGSSHWFYCDRHRVKWWVGADLFSGWRDEAKAKWGENARFLSAFREVELYYAGAGR